MQKITRVFLAAVLLLGTSAQAAILYTDFGTVYAEYGAAYPTLPGSPVNADTVSTDILTSGFGHQAYWTTPDPNYGWVEWDTGEDHVTLRAGQDVTFISDFGYSGYGFSSLDFLWSFSVDGVDGVLSQHLLSGTGSGEVLLFDVTTHSVSSYLSVECTGCSYSGGGVHDGGVVSLLDGHDYLLGVSLDNQSAYDGWEAEYYLSLGNSTIAVAEPEIPILLSSGLMGLLLTRWKRRGRNSPQS